MFKLYTACDWKKMFPSERRAIAESAEPRTPPRYSIERLLVSSAACEKQVKMTAVAENAVATIPESTLSATSTTPPSEAPLQAAKPRKYGSFSRAVRRDG